MVNNFNNKNNINNDNNNINKIIVIEMIIEIIIEIKGVDPVHLVVTEVMAWEVKIITIKALIVKYLVPNKEDCEDNAHVKVI